MKVLILPTNIASQISVMVCALRSIGVDAVGLANNEAPVQASDSVEFLEREGIAGRGGGKLSTKLWKWITVLRAIRKADVIHWSWGQPLLWPPLDIVLARLMGKVRIVEFWGSDIRIPEVAALDNPYYARRGLGYEHQESLQQSDLAQERFAKAGFQCMVCSEELLPYVRRDLFPHVHFVRQRLWIEAFQPVYPEAGGTRPVVMHSPTAPVCKGTPAVLSVIEILKKKLDFEFILNEGLRREEALANVRKADVFLDQFVIGAYGTAALEAMAMGKPVVCYIKPSVWRQLPPDTPIVNCTQDELAAVLEGLIQDGPKRNELGRKSRQFVEQHHDARKLAVDLVNVYAGFGKNRRP